MGQLLVIGINLVVSNNKCYSYINCLKNSMKFILEHLGPFIQLCIQNEPDRLLWIQT